MPRIVYIERNFAPSSVTIIKHANAIIEEYIDEGFDLTIRQLYYQFVSRDLIANKQSEYKRLGSIINDARLAGLIDWDSIVDRTRNLRSLSHWDNPSQIINACADQFRVDRWAGQDYRPEVWIEKDALTGVISGICDKLRVPYFSCRGYTSQSEVWRAGMRLVEHSQNGQIPFIIHLGDHDPSGIDMTRDIVNRLQIFTDPDLIADEKPFELKRIALNFDQVEKYSPPPNPAKTTDSRATGYIARFGPDSWELDALEPRVISKLIEKTVKSVRNDEKWKDSATVEAMHRNQLQHVADHWEEISGD